MKFAQLGKSTSEVEVTNISKHGFWLLLGGRELFLPFQDFPWFREVPVGRLLNAELPHPHHLYWPDLDVDLAVESIEHPERFPLVSRKGPNARCSRRRPKTAARLSLIAIRLSRQAALDESYSER